MMRPARLLVLGLASACCFGPAPHGLGTARAADDSARSDNANAASTTLLIESYQALLKDQDIEAFRKVVTSRFSEESLMPLVTSERPHARRAAVLALGLIGTMKANESVARGLADEDALVRKLASTALWDIWFRADTPENNARLKEIAALNANRDYGRAEELASKLILQAPAFAEAYNQRAIALFFQGRHADSARDCRRVLELNPWHIGALSGLGQCYLALGDRRQAVEVFRRVLKLQPHGEEIRRLLISLESVDA